MKKLNFKSFVYAALCALAAVACDPDYDVKPVNPGPKDPDNPSGPVIDPTISILPAVSLSVTRSVELTVKEFVPKDYDRIRTTTNGDFFIECHNDGSPDTLLTKDAFEEAPAVAIPAGFKLPFDLLPDYLETQLNLQCPVIFDVENPTDKPMMLSAKFSNASKEVEVSDIQVEAGKSQVLVDDIKSLLRPFSSDIHISDVVLSKVKPSEDEGGQAAPASADDLKFSVFPYMPLRFFAGDVIEFTYGADLFKKAKIKEFLEDNKLDSKYTKMSFEIEVSNGIPFDLALSSKSSSEVGGTISLSDKIAAGTPESPVVSKLTLFTEFKTSIKDINTLKFVIKASVPAGTEGFVTLNDAQKISVNILSLKVDEIKL